MTTVLVTGAAGFIGGAVARRFVADGARVLTIDNFSTGDRENVPEGVEIVAGDCQDPQVICSLEAPRFDLIVHVAGQSSGEISFDDPIYDIESNTLSTIRLLSLALERGCRRFIYASSMSVYGDCGETPAAEDMTPMPASFYGIGKMASEEYLRVFTDSHPIQATALRLFSVYGPGQNMENLRQGIVSIFVAQALRDRRIHVKGGAERFRDLIYIDDVVEAFVRASERTGRDFLVCNVGTGRATTVRDLVDAIRAALPYDVPVEFRGSTRGDIVGIRADVARAEERLGWRSSTHLADGLAAMIASTRSE